MISRARSRVLEELKKEFSEKRISGAPSTSFLQLKPESPHHIAFEAGFAEENEARINEIVERVLRESAGVTASWSREFADYLSGAALPRYRGEKQVAMKALFFKKR